MNSNIKRFTIVAIAIGLVCVLLVGSALALNVSYQKVSMPDPYGVMPLSLSSETTTRTIYNSKAITYGSSNSSYRATYASQSQTGKSSTTLVRTSPSSVHTNKASYISVPSGTYIDFTANVSFDPTEYQSLVVSGTVVSELFSYLWPYSSDTTTIAQSAKATPDTVQVLINGVPSGTIFNTSGSGSFTLSDQEFVLTDAITSVGFRFTWTSADTVTSSTGSYAYYRDYSLYFKVTDNVNLTPVTKADVDYIPYFERVISWLQTVSGNISTSNDWLSQIASSMSTMAGTGGIQAIVQSLDPTVENSQGWYTKEIADAFDTSTEGTVGNTISDIGSVYASDEDLQLKEDSAPIVSAATDAFYNQDTSTAITTEKVSDAQTALQGAGAMFDSGYEVGDIFTDISENSDDYMSWFTSEAAGWLDTVPAAASDPDDPDPFNHHYIENQYAAIKKARGEGD